MKVIVFKKTGIMIGLCCILLAVTVIVFSADKALTVMATPDRPLPVYSVETDDKKLAVTFDAAWGADDTDELIAILKKHNAKATFFVTGQWAQKYPECVKAFDAEGHLIAGHSYNHTLYTKLNTQELSDDINLCNKIISSLTHKEPDILRVPSGDYNERVIKQIYAMNLYPIQWDVDSRDWKEDYTTDMIVKGVTDHVKSGSIVLFHNAAKNTPKALPIILERLIAEGYSFKLISEMIYKDNYEIIHDGTQIQN